MAEGVRSERSIELRLLQTILGSEGLVVKIARHAPGHGWGLWGGYRLPQDQQAEAEQKQDKAHQPLPRRSRPLPGGSTGHRC